jgi:hypothetical protein
MHRLLPLALLALVLGASGCYHAQVTTGQPASGQVVERSFATSWINGLVPPDVTNVAQECPNGVARVETQLSFVNQLVTALTLGIYSPMTIRVTCAASGSAALDAQETVPVAAGASPEEVRQAFGAAADLAVGSGKPVLVHFAR